MSDEPTTEDRRVAATHVLLAESETDRLTSSWIDIDDEVEHHLRRVLRIRGGEQVSVTDGAGRWRMCAAHRGDRVRLESTSAIAAVPEPPAFTLATAIPKGDRVDWLVQKTTELGASRILLLHTERSVVRWKPERAAKQVLRLQRIADEALRQSRGVWRCVVEGPIGASEVLAEAAVSEPGGERIRGDESMIAIGPEGGWTTAELACTPRRVSIGDSILRTETAGVAATALRMVGGH